MRTQLVLLAALAGLLAGCDANEQAAHPPGDRSADAPAEWAANWPLFRGPFGDGGAADDASPPAEVDPATDVVWRVPVPAQGPGSPVIWGDRIYLTGEPDRILAFDRASGALLWDTPIGGPGEETFEPSQAGLAAPTACTDGRRVYAFFGSGVMGCVDAVTGEFLWNRPLVENPNNPFGLAASPVLYGDLVIQSVDLETDDEGDEPVFHSFVVALRAASGEEAWRAPKPTYPAWATPLVIRAGTRGGDRDVLVTIGSPWILGLDPATGEELWRAGGLAGDVAASPAAADGVVYAASDGQGPVMAVRLGGRGDVTESHVLWRWQEHMMPDTCSVACDGEHYLHVTDASRVIGLDARTGILAWDLPLEGGFQSSPVLADGRAYVFNVSGRLYVIDPAAGTVLSQAELGEDVAATPAILDGEIYVRSEGHLLRIGR